MFHPATRLRASTTTTNKTDAFWCSSTVAAALAIVLFSPSLDFGREWPDRSEEGERERRVAFSEIELAAVTGGRG